MAAQLPLSTLLSHTLVAFTIEFDNALRAALETLVVDPRLELSPLAGGLEPWPGGWRASVRKPDTLPHYPMVLHRGGWPDGS